MSKYLCTFPGKFGDILWSLPTAKYIAEKVVSQPVDFAVMPYYESLLPLLQEQSYIDNAIVIPGWLRTHSNYGDQPWEAPKQVHLSWEKILSSNPVQYVLEEYERIWHLGYRCHPGRAFGNVEMPLMDFIAYQQGITFNETMIPFLTAEPANNVLTQLGKEMPFVAMAFNEQYAEQKETFKNEFIHKFISPEHPSLQIVELDKLSWQQAAAYVGNKNCIAFVGDRSANWVIANGLGKLCITFEPHPSRHRSGQLGVVFGCPQGQEFALPFGMPPVVAAQTAAAVVKRRIEERTMIAHG